jgi:general stress protein 26
VKTSNHNHDQMKKVADAMRDMDFCMLTTTDEDGVLRSRPMSNNGEVEFDGDVWFFSAADSRKVTDIRRKSAVHLAFADPKKFRFISMAGAAELVDDVEKKQELWVADLDRWFPEGPTDDNVVLIKVTPADVGIWDKEDEVQIKLTDRRALL